MNKQRVLKEIIIYVVIFVISAFVMHLNQWTTDPITHISALLQSKDVYHPLLYSFIIYFIIFIIRFLFSLILRLFKK